MTLNVALIGAGIFARSAHVPALNVLVMENRVKVVAVYARTPESVATTKNLLTPNEHVKSYHGDDIDKLLALPDLHAVIIVTPIDTLPDLVAKALAAGKHVLSEKPVAPTLEIGKSIIQTHTTKFSSLIWGVAENYYYEPAFLKAREIILQGAIGTPRVVNSSFITSMGTESAYYHTKWRQNPIYQGGYLLDAGVHQIAALRLLLGDIERISGISKMCRENLPPADTLVASIALKSGCVGTVTTTFACTKIPSPFSEFAPPLFAIHGDKGTMNVWREKVEVITQDSNGTSVLKPKISRDEKTAIVGEISAFLECILAKQVLTNPHTGLCNLYSPEEALKDVAFFESILNAK